MRPPRITGRDGAVLLGVLVVILGVVWGTARVAQLSADRDRLEGQVRTLADQVRGLGGTPKVAPPPPPAAGKNGQPGSAGQSGRNGSTGPPGKSGSTGASGPPGTPGSAGSAGQPGEQGPPGADGKDGTDGKDGSPPSRWTFTYLGVTYTCTPTSEGATTYTCEPDGVSSPASDKRG